MRSRSSARNRPPPPRIERHALTSSKHHHDAPSLPARLLGWLHAFENGVLVLLVLTLVVLAATQIMARFFFDSGWVWIDPATRALVLWTAMLGAVAAARDERHINLDAITRLLKGPWLRLARFVTFAFAAVVCGFIAYYSVGLVQLDRESGTMAFAKVPAWMVELIMPTGFGLLALRFALRSLIKPAPAEPPA